MTCRTWIPPSEDDSEVFQTPETKRPRRACVQQTLNNIKQSLTGVIPQLDGVVTDSDLSKDPTPNQSPEGLPMKSDQRSEENSFETYLQKSECFLCHRSCPTLLDPHLYGSDEPPVFLFENVRKRSSSLSDMEIYNFNMMRNLNLQH